MEALSAQLQIFTNKSFDISTTLGKYINWLDSDDPKFVAEYIENNCTLGTLALGSRYNYKVYLHYYIFSLQVYVGCFLLSLGK